MKLEQILLDLQPSDAVGRKSWYQENTQYMPRLRRGPGGLVKRVKSAEGSVTNEPYELSDEDRVANDWVIVQSNENPNL